jgi:hypothetical protein
MIDHQVELNFGWQPAKNPVHAALSKRPPSSSLVSAWLDKQLNISKQLLRKAPCTLSRKPQNGPGANGCVTAVTAPLSTVAVKLKQTMRAPERARGH